MSDVTVVRGGALAPHGEEEVSLIRRTLCTDASDDELALFLEYCRRRGLDPLGRQIYPIKRGGKLSYQISIDGLRAIAADSGEYEGQTEPQWCGADGIWRDVWLDDEPPAAARVGVWRKGFRAAAVGVATYREYVQLENNGRPAAMWVRMAGNQLAKCAEGLALRKAFPGEIGGLYSAEEMGQADSPVRRVARPVTQVAAAKVAAPNGKPTVWPGPGKCPGCGAPEGKLHGTRCSQPDPPAGGVVDEAPTARELFLGELVSAGFPGELIGDDAAVKAVVKALSPALWTKKRLTDGDWHALGVLLGEDLAAGKPLPRVEPA